MSPIDRYLRRMEGEGRRRLAEVVRVIRRAAPGAEEVISYRIPAFRYRGRILVYVAAFAAHIGFFPPVHGALKKAAAPYAGPKGNLRFPFSRKTPLALIRRIVAARVKDADARVKKSKKRTTRQEG